MKLAKKILACALALALSVCLGAVAFAADAPRIDYVAKFAEDGTVTIHLTAVGAKTTVLAQLKFDTEKFDYVGFDSGDGDADGGVAVDNSSVLATTAMSMKEFKGDVDLGTFTLKAKDGVDVGEFTYTEDSNIDETTSISGTITLKREAPTTKAPTTAATTKGDDGKNTTKSDDTGKKTTTGKGTSIPKNGDAGIAVVAGISALAAVAFVVTKKK